jgi:Uma2 family endonuclease
MHLDDDRVLGLLDADKPYIEVFDGRGREKIVSPEWPHAHAQVGMARILDDYSQSYGGDVGTELRFVTSTTSGEDVTLLPDVSYYSEQQMRAATPDERRYPRHAPYVAVEIRSSDDRPGERERKIELLLALGSRLVLDVSPQGETVTAIDANGRRTFHKQDIFVHDALPELRIDLTPFFERVNRRYD